MSIASLAAEDGRAFLLPSYSSDNLIEESDEDLRKQARKSSFRRRISIVLILTAVFINGVAVINIILPPVERPSKHGNPYVGLSHLPLDPSESTPTSRIDFPFLLTQISNRYPDKVWQVGRFQYEHEVGSIEPDVREFYVDSEEQISTIAQFRAVDYKMENCTLHLALPPSTSSSPVPVPPSLELYRLDAPSRLDPFKLSSSTLPHRLEKLAGAWSSVSIDSRDSWTFASESFRCPWGAYQAFQVTCGEKGDSDEECRTQFLMDMRDPNLGLTLHQYSGFTE